MGNRQQMDQLFEELLVFLMTGCLETHPNYVLDFVYMVLVAGAHNLVGPIIGTAWGDQVDKQKMWKILQFCCNKKLYSQEDLVCTLIRKEPRFLISGQDEKQLHNGFFQLIDVQAVVMLLNCLSSELLKFPPDKKELNPQDTRTLVTLYKRYIFTKRLDPEVFNEAYLAKSIGDKALRIGRTLETSEQSAVLSNVQEIKKVQKKIALVQQDRHNTKQSLEKQIADNKSQYDQLVQARENQARLSRKSMDTNFDSSPNNRKSANQPGRQKIQVKSKQQQHQNPKMDNIIHRKGKQCKNTTFLKLDCGHHNCVFCVDQRLSTVEIKHGKKLEDYYVRCLQNEITSTSCSYIFKQKDWDNAIKKLFP